MVASGISDAPGGAVECVTFRLEGTDYAMPLRSVVEVLRMVRLTPYPEGPRWFVGMLNLRGSGLGVVDLRLRLGRPPLDPSPEMAILVVRAGGQTFGLIVDEVIEVDRLTPEPMAYAGWGGSALVPAVAHLGDRSILVIDPERILDHRDGTPAGTT